MKHSLKSLSLDTPASRAPGTRTLVRDYVASLLSKVKPSSKLSSRVKVSSNPELVTNPLTPSQGNFKLQPTNTTTSSATTFPSPLPPSPRRLTLWVDAGVLDYGSKETQGFIAVVDDNGVLVDEPIGSVTNDEGELLAIRRALLIAGDDPALIYSDSLAAVNMVNRRWRGKAPNLRVIAKTIQIPPHIQIEWTPREENRAGHYLETAYGA